MHYMNGWPTQGFAGIGGPIVMLIIGLAVIGVLVYLVIAVSRNKQGNTSNALNILEERYVKGELSKEDFEAMRKTLRG